ncbi:MAG: hypothetical protein C0490_04875, partial [Marivirga sp.]|nr:hypothetical protein [Marivirga sp.]
ECFTMNNTFNGIRLVCIPLVILSACLEPYPPPESVLDLEILVVDGFLNSTDGSATVRLSHAVPLSSDVTFEPEANATVRIHADNGDSFMLTLQDSGRYFAAGLQIVPTLKYQLRIRTSDDKEYISDYIEIKQSPEIDSVIWKPGETGLEILVNTHDNTGNTRYYRWDYLETWEYHSPATSAFKLVDNEVVFRSPEDYLHKCWNTVPSTKILIGSSFRLAEDLIRDFPLISLPQFSDKISVQYSVLVKQRALSKIEFEFWSDLQKVTEGVGSLFDSQPYEIKGNIHNASDPSIPVVGFFSGGSVMEERIFIDYRDLPANLRLRPYKYCVMDTACLIRTPSTFYPCIIDVPSLTANSLLVGELHEGSTLWGYTFTTPRCADCRIAGGTLTKPAFWP